MKHFFLFFILLIFITGSHAQTTDSSILSDQQKRITLLEQRCDKLQRQNESMTSRMTVLEKTTGVFATQLSATDSTIASVDSLYGQRLQQTNDALSSNENKQQKSIVWGIVIAVLLAIITLLTFILLRKRISKKDDDIASLRERADAFSQRADELNQKIIERMDKELEELQKIAKIDSNKSNNNLEPDHSLVQALAYGITRIEYNLHNMSPDIRGYKQLQIALRKMKDNLRANNYEIVEMLGQEYNEGMTLSNVTFIDDSKMDDDRQIITRVIQPQINYQGKVIQFADIEVSRKEQ